MASEGSWTNSDELFDALTEEEIAEYIGQRAHDPTNDDNQLLYLKTPWVQTQQNQQISAQNPFGTSYYGGMSSYHVHPQAHHSRAGSSTSDDSLLVGGNGNGMGGGMSGGASSSMANGYGSNGDGTGDGSGSGVNGRKRRWDEPDLQYEIKSPRYSPGLPASPARNGFVQRDEIETRPQDPYGAETPNEWQMTWGEDLARKLQESYDQGATPDAIDPNPYQDAPDTIDPNPYQGATPDAIDPNPYQDAPDTIDPNPYQGATPDAIDPNPYQDAPVAINSSSYQLPVAVWHPALEPTPTLYRPSNPDYIDLTLGSPAQLARMPFSDFMYANGPAVDNGIQDDVKYDLAPDELPGLVKNYVDYVSNDPTKTADQIRSLLENIRPDMKIPKEQREGTPDAMYYPLMEHQRVGLTWLKMMEEGKTRGGILADDMGLGKTIQMLALLVSRPSQNPKCKTTLVVAPVALLKQWEREIKNKLKKDHQLTVFIYHGSGKKDKSFSDLAKYDVVLTTFGMVASEFKRKEAHNRAEAAGQGPRELPFTLLGNDSHFYRIVIDEAQWIKNKDTQSSKGCAYLRAKYRFCLSGTPMQNSCDELFSLLRFLGIKPYNEWMEFSTTFSRPLKNKIKGSATQALEKLQALLKAVLLRRTKSSMIDGKPILTLPPKSIEMVHSVFSPDERAFYDALESRSKIVFNKYLKQSAVGRNYSNLLVLLLRLRQACCHPHLINDIEEPKGPDELSQMKKLVGELTPDAVDRIKQSESLECPVCFDVSENPSIVVPCGHLFCKECLLQVQDTHEQHSMVRGDDTSKLKCPGCRGDMDMNKVTDLKTFKLVHPPEGAQDGFQGSMEEEDDELIYDSDSDEDECDDESSLAGFVVNDSDEPIGNGKGKKSKAKANSKSKPKDAKGKGKAKKGRTLAEVRRDAMKNDRSRKIYHKYLEKRWVDSAKISKCVDIIEDIQTNRSEEKTIVFSQFTSLLDLLEIPISRKGISYRRYDGGLSSMKRNQSLMDFQDDPDIKVLLVSLKAGNSGLNLVAASQVIIFDPFYNPYIELQAIDRAHRIGQQRPVVVHRLVVPGTVEDRVLELQEKKKMLIEGALDENAQHGIGRMTARDLGFLFGIEQFGR